MTKTPLQADPLRKLADLSAGQQSELDELRKLRRQVRKKALKDAAPLGVLPSTLGQRVADRVSWLVGSWRFILVQSALIAAWIIWNLVRGTGAPDPYPFILLNLLLSFQAAYTAPAIMMSQNRQAEVDRQHAEDDYVVNVKAEMEIELLHEKIDYMREQ